MIRSLRILNIASAALIVGGVTLAEIAAEVSYGLTRERGRTCNGQLPMPLSAYVLGWAAVGVAILALVAVIVRIQRIAGVDTLVKTLLVFAILGLLGAGFVAYTIYDDAVPIRHLCFGWWSR